MSPDSVKNTWRRKPIVIAVAILFMLLVIVLLVALVLRSGILSNNPIGDAGVTPTTTPTELAAGPGEDEPAETGPGTPTPTRVVGEEDEAAATPTSTTSPAEEDEDQPTPTATRPSQADTGGDDETDTGADTTLDAEQVALSRVDVIQNGGFEQGFQNSGVAKGWRRFDNGGAQYIFAEEGWPNAILSGDSAQRITIVEAHQPDRYAGIYQTVDVIPGQTYILVLYGQIRSGFGDVSASDYGYRMQYAIDYSGGTDWEDIPAEDWIELPWDEQPLDGADVEFQIESDAIIPPRSQMTIFIRAWNKWPLPVESQYTLDGLSLIGPAPGDQQIDGALPGTGGTGESGLPLHADPRFWASLLILAFLVGSAVWRQRHRRQIPRS